ncbi:MAG: DoxX family protein [Sphingobacteriaceae bacterium]|nr:MAG: DoxX family protein [Sphingobacteriaceae bacterium]
MKTIKISYWTVTAIVALSMTFSAALYVTDPNAAKGFQHLGFPDYFRIELAVAKFIAAIVLLAPIAVRVKEWAYAGLAITFISAFIAHTASGDAVGMRIAPLISLALLVTSYILYHKKEKASAVVF